MNHLLQIQQLAIGHRSHRQGHPLCRGLNASLPAATLTALVGANGAGKSTLLRTLAALLPALEGDVLLNGHSLYIYTPRELARRIGIVLTGRMDVPHLRVRDVVEAGRMPYTGLSGRLSAADHERVEEAMVLTRTTDFAHRTIDSLSDGERQRVMIAKALAQDTQIILLDEPTAFLDFATKAELMQLLHRLAHGHNKTILLSTHDLELAFQTVDRLWLLAREGLVEGDARQLMDSGRLADFFAAQGLQFDKRTGRFCLPF